MVCVGTPRLSTLNLSGDPAILAARHADGTAKDLCLVTCSCCGIVSLAVQSTADQKSRMGNLVDLAIPNIITCVISYEFLFKGHLRICLETDKSPSFAVRPPTRHLCMHNNLPPTPSRDKHGRSVTNDPKSHHHAEHRSTASSLSW